VPDLELRPMTETDLVTFERWLHEPHFGRWFLQDTTIEAELANNRASITSGRSAVALMAELDARTIGWAQWYDWWDYPAAAAAVDALPGEAGIDYGIGEPDCVGRGLGTALIAALVGCVRAQRPDASIMTTPSAANVASRRVLERNGFALIDVRDIAGEPDASPLALYRLDVTDRHVGRRRAGLPGRTLAS
jgi:aminoglycoside 6'-N-acetyltransferase